MIDRLHSYRFSNAIFHGNTAAAGTVIPASTAYKKIVAVYLKKLLFKMDSLNNSLSLMVFRWSNPALIRLKKCLDPLVTCPSFLILNEIGA